MNAQSKGAALLTQATSIVEAYEAAKEAASGTMEKKAARQATNLASTLADLEMYADLQNMLVGIASDLTGQVADLVDTTEGEKVFATVSGLLAADEDYRPVGFDAEVASDLVERWGKATRRTRGSGGGSTPPSQMLPCPVRVTFTYPEGAETSLKSVIEHSSTWSSVSAEITKRAMALSGLERGDDYDRPEAAKVAWREAVQSIKNDGPGGVVEVETPAGVMLAEVSAVR